MDKDTLTAIFAGVIASLWTANTIANTPYGKGVIDYFTHKIRLQKAIQRAFKEGYVDDGSVPIAETEFVPLKTKKGGKPILNDNGQQMYAIRFWANDSTTLDELFPGTLGIVAKDLIKKARDECSSGSPCIFAHLGKVITPDMREHNDNPEDPIENHILRQFIISNSETLNKAITIRMPNLGETYDYQNVFRVLIDEKEMRQDRLLILDMPEWQAKPENLPKQSQIADVDFIEGWNAAHPDEEIDFDFDFDPSVQHERYKTMVAAGEELKRQAEIMKSSNIRKKIGIIPADDPSASVSELA